MRVSVSGVWVRSVGLEFTGCFRGPLSFFAQPAGILRGSEMPPREVANAAMAAESWAFRQAETSLSSLFHQ